jgi:tetratricopeptide (TPR) repeat protein
VAEVGDGIEALLVESDSLADVKRFSAAAERAQDAARRAPEDPRPFWAWARALYGEGQFAEAARMADESIRLAPESAPGFRLRSISLSSLARTLPKDQRAPLGAEAVASAREAVRLAPANANCHLALAQALPLTGDVREADRAVQELLRLAPNNAASWVTASLVALAAKNWNAAISASKKALEIEPENYAALNNLGVALRASGKSREGTRVLAEAARTNPDAHLARQNLSRAGLSIVRVAVLILLLPLLFLTGAGWLGFIALSLGSNIAISRSPALALRLERIGAPVALFFAGKSREVPAADLSSPRGHRKRKAAQEERPWSATAGHSMHTLGNPVLIFCAISAWSVALVLLIGVVVPGSDKLGLAIGFVGFAALGALPAWVVRGRKRQDKAWATQLIEGQKSTHP